WTGASGSSRVHVSSQEPKMPVVGQVEGENGQASSISDRTICRGNLIAVLSTPAAGAQKKERPRAMAARVWPAGAAGAWWVAWWAASATAKRQRRVGSRQAEAMAAPAWWVVPPRAMAARAW